MHKIGVEKGVECVDIYGFEEDVLAFIPRPCYAVILCFPVVDKVLFLSCKLVYDRL